jgi:tetratricopeptide (TPR) repeat protein
MNRGFAFFDRWEFDRAISDLDRALTLYYKQLGIKQDHREIYRELAQLKKGHLNICNFIAVKYSEINYFYVAEVLLSKIIAMDPQNEEAYVNLCAVYGSSGKYREAVEVGEAAIAINPSSAVAHYNLSVAYYLEGKADLALKHLDTASKLGMRPTQEFPEVLLKQKKKNKK